MPLAQTSAGHPLVKGFLQGDRRLCLVFSRAILRPSQEHKEFESHTCVLSSILHIRQRDKTASAISSVCAGHCAHSIQLTEHCVFMVGFYMSHAPFFGLCYIDTRLMNRVMGVCVCFLKS